MGKFLDYTKFFESLTPDETKMIEKIVKDGEDAIEHIWKSGNFREVTLRCGWLDYGYEILNHETIKQPRVSHAELKDAYDRLELFIEGDGKEKYGDNATAMLFKVRYEDKLYRIDYDWDADSSSLVPVNITRHVLSDSGTPMEMKNYITDDEFANGIVAKINKFIGKPYVAHDARGKNVGLKTGIVESEDGRA